MLLQAMLANHLGAKLKSLMSSVHNSTVLPATNCIRSPSLVVLSMQLNVGAMRQRFNTLAVQQQA